MSPRSPDDRRDLHSDMRARVPLSGRKGCEMTLHIMHEGPGWVIKQAIEEAACLVIPQKIEAIAIAAPLASPAGRPPEVHVLDVAVDLISQ